MDNLGHLFFSFDGRIGRRRFWIGILGLAIAVIVISLVILPVLGLSMMGGIPADMNNNQEIYAFFDGQMRRGGWISLIMLIVFAWPSLAVMIKRAHDRGSAGMLVYAGFALTGLSDLFQGLGLTHGASMVEGMPVPGPNLLGIVLSVAMTIIGLILLVTLGFLKGTKGSNPYGVDPLAA